ncbi:hypothetical protein Pla110_10000 [Polystyrenella longa]|uniref:Uncharacterized protein n=1 Tax=Polystyrenella longa TaxID=2528007 RepID=A0A518CJ85_9PLAN|nr:hypothetical protein [Polystyrenella longa]QDU79292.1 hypothetical protein Pla110_10000 [Polystyrenella longa]
MTTSLKRLGAILVISIGLIASLLTFPAVVPWMIAGWLSVATVFMVRQGPG